MTKSDYKIGDTSGMLASLNRFTDIEEKFDEIRKKVNINKDELLPSDYYSGIKEFDSAEFASNAREFCETIEKFKNYIKDMGYISADGKLDAKESLFKSLGLSSMNVFAANGIIVSLKAFILLMWFKNFSKIFALNPLISGKKTTKQNYVSGGSSYSGDNYSSDNKITDIDVSDGEETVSDLNFNEDDIDDDYLELEEDEIDDSIINDTDEDITGNDGNNEENVIDDGNNSGIDINKIIDEVKDASGNVVAVSVIGEGKKNWYQVSGDNVIIPSENISTYKLGHDISIVDGKENVTIPTGNYNVDQVIYNADGSLRSVRFIYDDKKVWAYLDSNGNVVKAEYIKNQNGMFSITNPNYDMIDMYGNNIGKFKSDRYFIYDVLYDAKGNEIAYRLSPDGEYEKWVYPNGNLTDATVEIFTKIQKGEGTSIQTIDDSSNNKGLYGVLGLLFVALGTTLVVRKKVKDKENAAYANDDYSSESENSTLSAGNYGIYDVKTDDDGKITEARINPVDSSDEYWVEV